MRDDDPDAKSPDTPGGDGPEEPGDDVVELPIEDRLDLHAIPPREVREVVLAYVEEAAARGFSEVRLIHGRGSGVQRRIVRSALGSSPVVLEIRDATPDRGGWGATVALLRTIVPGV